MYKRQPEELSVRHVLLGMEPSYLPMVDDDVDSECLQSGSRMKVENSMTFDALIQLLLQRLAGCY